jgi:hypothetical protein
VFETTWIGGGWRPIKIDPAPSSLIQFTCVSPGRKEKVDLFTISSLILFFFSPLNNIKIKSRRFP